VRSAAMLALAAVVPLVFLGVIPDDVSASAAAISAFFPFAPAARALAGVLVDPSPWRALTRGVLHLSLLCAAYGLCARLAVRRLEA
jgi:hypothetical protein